MEMQDLRKTIDEIDDGIVELYRRRMETVREISRYKREKGLPVADPAREEQLLDRVAERAGAENAEGVRELFRLLMSQSRARQQAERKAEGRK